MTCGIYEIVNTANGKRYVGSSVDVEKRWKHHLWRLGRKDHHSVVLQRAWDKYGECSFKFSILHECEADDLLIIEQSEINLKSEYNISPVAGSNEGHRWTEEQKIAHRASKRAYYEGNDEVKEKISEGVRKAQSRPEVIRAISDGVKKAFIRPEVKEKLASNTRKRWQDPEYRKSMSEMSKRNINRPEHKEAVRKATSGKNSKKHNPTVYHFTHEVHGDRICTQWDLKNEFTDLQSNNVSQICSGAKGSHKGWKVRSAP